MLKRWIGQIALYYCRDVFLCQREAAIVARNTLRMGLNGVMPINQAVERTVSSLELQIQALEALMNLSEDG
ncbi:MAG: hypothetical protein ACRC62_28920 [Microcoleus sp.]